MYDIRRHITITCKRKARRLIGLLKLMKGFDKRPGLPPCSFLIMKIKLALLASFVTLVSAKTFTVLKAGEEFCTGDKLLMHKHYPEADNDVTFVVGHDGIETVQEYNRKVQKNKEYGKSRYCAVLNTYTGNLDILLKTGINKAGNNRVVRQYKYDEGTTRSDYRHNGLYILAYPDRRIRMLDNTNEIVHTYRVSMENYEAMFSNGLNFMRSNSAMEHIKRRAMNQVSIYRCGVILRESRPDIYMGDFGPNENDDEIKDIIKNHKTFDTALILTSKGELVLQGYNGKVYWRNNVKGHRGPYKAHFGELAYFEVVDGDHKAIWSSCKFVNMDIRTNVFEYVSKKTRNFIDLVKEYIRTWTQSHEN